MADRSKSRMKVVVSKDAPPPPIPESGPVAAETEDEAEEGSARWIWLALGGATVLALGLAAWHYVTLYTSVDGARSDLVAVEEGLTEVGFAAEQSDLDEAREHLASAADNVDTAKAHFSYDPLIRLAGVLPGDVVVNIDERRVTTADDVETYLATLNGEGATVLVRRDGVEQTIVYLPDSSVVDVEPVAVAEPHPTPRFG